jgi:hypothetical protein
MSASKSIPTGQPLAQNVASLPRVSKSVPVILSAATILNGQTTPSEISLTQAGDRFYVIATSAPVAIQSLRAGNVGATNSFQNGQGQTVSQGFDTLAIKNFNAFPIVALVWIGFEDFINDQLVLNQTSTPQVTNPTQPIATGSAGDIQIPDLSGQQFTDINGKKWYAISRVAIIISNISPSVLTLQKFGNTSATGNAVLMIPAGLPIAHNSSGSFTISVGGGPVQAIVSEIYNSIAA